MGVPALGSPFYLEGIDLPGSIPDIGHSERSPTGGGLTKPDKIHPENANNTRCKVHPDAIDGGMRHPVVWDIGRRSNSNDG